MSTPAMDISFQYPPELLNLLIDVIPLLNRSKKDVFVFFQGAGVSDERMRGPYQQWQQDKDSITKFDIVRQVLVVLNKHGEACLRDRREILKRVVEFESFDACWPTDQLKAKGLVAEIRKVINTKDSFTRMNIERETERQARLEKTRTEQGEKAKRKKEVQSVREQLAALFGIDSAYARAKALEGVLNALFRAYGVAVRESFTLTGDSGEGIVEQIDGVIELKGYLYLVEMKWWQTPLGVPEISQHLVRVYHRSDCRAVIISASGFTEPAIATCKEALQHKVIVLCSLEELVRLLETQGDLLSFLERKTQAAMVDKNPFLRLV